jgi:hypothetical protein
VVNRKHLHILLIQVHILKKPPILFKSHHQTLPSILTKRHQIYSTNSICTLCNNFYTKMQSWLKINSHLQTLVKIIYILTLAITKLPYQYPNHYGYGDNTNNHSILRPWDYQNNLSKWKQHGSIKNLSIWYKKQPSKIYTSYFTKEDLRLPHHLTWYNTLIIFITNHIFNKVKHFSHCL